MLFPGAMSFLTDGIFIDSRREDGAFSNYTPSEEPLHSFNRHLLKPNAVLGPEMQRKVRHDPCMDTDITI